MNGTLEKKDFVWRKMTDLGQPGFDPIDTMIRVSNYIAAKWIRVTHWEALPKGAGTNRDSQVCGFAFLDVLSEQEGPSWQSF